MKTQQLKNDLEGSPHNTTDTTNGQASPCKVPWCNREATTTERCDIHTEVHEAYTKAKHEPYSAEEADAEIAVQAQSNERGDVFEHRIEKLGRQTTYYIKSKRTMFYFSRRPGQTDDEMRQQGDWIAKTLTEASHLNNSESNTAQQ